MMWHILFVHKLAGWLYPCLRIEKNYMLCKNTDKLLDLSTRVSGYSEIHPELVR